MTFGPAGAQSITVNSYTSITVTTPPGSGIQAVQVHTPYGVSAADPAGRFTYQTMTISPGGIYLGYHAFSVDSWVHIAVSDFPPDSAVSYTCTAVSGFYQAFPGAGVAGTTYTTDAAGATVQTDANGSASFDSVYIAVSGSVTCTSGIVSATGTFTYEPPPWPGGSVSVTPGAPAPTDVCSEYTSGTCNYVHIVVTNFPANSIVDYGCTGLTDAGPAVSDTNSDGAIAVTDASGYASFDTSMAFPTSSFGPPAGISNAEVSCTSNGIWVDS